MNILLVAPATPETFWSFQHIMRIIARKAAYPPLGLLTVAAMLPRSWTCRLVDLNVSRLTDDAIAWADYVLLSGMIVHAKSANEIVARCKRQSKTIIAGGPLFTTGYQQFNDIGHFVLGEAEHVMPELIQDMRSGKLKRIYQAHDRPDLTTTPIPRWDLISLKDYASMPVQFSRGCPFNCEFCDITVMYGRVPRTKQPAQVIAELDALFDAGWEDDVFLVDDNLIGHPGKAKALLRELITWRRRRGAKSVLTIEATLNLVDVPGLLNLMVDAGVGRVFVGIETPDVASLVECNKLQNAKRDMSAAISTIQNAGIEVMGGFIVGFDNDKPDVFERQWKFIQENGIATAMVGLLTALPETALYQRLKSEGRLLLETTGNNLDAVLNFAPRLDRELLTEGYRKLVQRLYAPDAFYNRALTCLRNARPAQSRTRVGFHELQIFVKTLWIMGVRTRGRRKFWSFLARTLMLRPRALPEAVRLAILGFHFRCVAARL